METKIKAEPNCILDQQRKNLPLVSIIDFHGLFDPTIPYDVNSPGTLGEGPHNTVISSWYFYLDQGRNIKSE